MFHCRALHRRPLVVKNNDEADRLQAISAQSTPLNARFWRTAHNARARVGLRRSFADPKVVNNDFLQSWSYTIWGP